MQVPLQITMRDIPHSEAVEQKIRQKADKLNQFSDKIISCHVVIEQEQSHRQNGKRHNVRICLTLPAKKELVVNHNHEENLYIAIRDAFDDMTRQIESSMQKIHGDVKNHALIIQGKIVRLFTDGEFGFIESGNGDEYYFNASNLTHAKFSQLKVGTIVNFVEAMGDEGPCAHHVKAREVG